MKPGFAFGEHIKTEKIRRRNYDDSPPSYTMRGYLLPVALGLVLATLIFKLVSLQIFQGERYRQLADTNRIRTKIVHAPRGIIFDRNGIALVHNVPGFRRTTPRLRPVPSGTGLRAASQTNQEEIKTELLTKEEALKLIAKGAKNIEVDSHREYLQKEVFAHVIGYIGQISKEEIEQKEYEDYQPTDWVGKSGIERIYEHLLRGKDGKQLIEVDSLGKEIRSLGQTDPVPGQDVTLTVDAKLQEAVFAAAKEIKKGAVIVSTPEGEILAMVSKPSFDPNLFILDTTYTVSTDSAHQSLSAVLNDNQNQPLLNRSISGIYPPGSTFKIITAAAGLENRIIDERYSIVDTGIIRIGEFSYANWFYTDYGKKEQGKIDVRRALARSNDIFFYRLAEKIDIPRLSEMAIQFGSGKKLGIDIGGEEAGLVPTKQWKKEHIGENWYLGDTYHYGIGQGFLLTTPLQVNAWTQVIANGGTLYQPRLIKNQKSKIKNQKFLNDKTIDLITNGMVASCEEGGVAYPLFDFKVKNPELKIDGKNILEVKTGSRSASLKDMREIRIACKTGTAQHGGEDTLPHAWITLFAPAYKPEIVVTVLSESSGEGSKIAAPIAKKILEAYFGKN